MTIEKINASLPPSTKIDQLNSMILELEGLIEQAKFNLTEISSLYTGSGLAREYKRSVGIGNTLTTYSNWSHIHAEDSYSIWKYTPTNYTYNDNNRLYFDNKVLSNRGEADSETALTFDKVFLYDGSYVDDTTEAGTESGTAFELMGATTDFLYLGSSATFNGISFEFDTRGSNYTIIPEFYHTGAGWCGLTSGVDNLSDQTSNFTSNGRVSWDLSGSGSGWIMTPVNAQHKYWVRFKTTSTPVTIAEANNVRPSDSVITLLSLSGDEVLNEDWAFCSYNSSIYATIRNKGKTAYEGSYYITSASSAANKQNYFIYNHEFTADYKDSSFDPTTSSYYFGDPNTNNTWRVLRSGSSLVFQRRESAVYKIKSIISP